MTAPLMKVYRQAYPISAGRVKRKIIDILRLLVLIKEMNISKDTPKDYNLHQWKLEHKRRAEQAVWNFMNAPWPQRDPAPLPKPQLKEPTSEGK